MLGEQKDLCLMYQCEACYSWKVNSSCLSLVLKYGLYIPNLSPFCLSNAYPNFLSQFSTHSSDKYSFITCGPSPKLNLLSMFCRQTTLLVTNGSQTLVRSKELPGAYYKVQMKILFEKKRIQSNTFGQGSFMSHQPSPPTVEVFIWDLNTVHQVSISCGVYASTDLVIALQGAVRTCEWVPNLYSFETTPCQA